MRFAGRSPSTVVAALLAVALLVLGTACSSGDGSAPSDERGGPSGPSGSGDSERDQHEEPRLDIDPRSFYENYQSSEGDMAASGAPTTAAPAPNGGAGSGSSSQTNRSTAADGLTAEAGPSAPPAPSAPTDIAPPEPGPEPGPLPPTPEPTEPGFLDDNTFTDSGDNPFVATSDDPRSTFGLDVDTGSYTVGRTFLTEGYRPDPASVRTEEWVNAFGYDYEPPSDGDLAVHVDGAPAPFTSDGTRLVRVGVQGRTVTRQDRPEAAITLVVDTSGSMDIRERLGLVQSTLALLALELKDSDTVSVVTFDDDAQVILPPTPAEDAERIVASIGQLTPSGGTNMDAGLREGYAQARSAFRPGAINTVVLASDGVANLGITGTDPLSDLVRSEGQDGISLVTVGYGMGNYNDTLMEQLADRGDGFYSYVDTYEEAERLFTTSLTSTLTVIASEARAQVAFDPETVASYRLVGYENRDIADDSFRDDSVDAGELGAGHTVTALYEVRLAAGVDEDDDASLGRVTVRHRPAGEDSFVEDDVSFALGDLAPRFSSASASLRLAGSVAAFAELLAGQPVATERGVTLDGLDELVAGIVADTGESPGSDGSPRAGRGEDAGEGIAVGEPAPNGRRAPDAPDAPDDAPPADEPILDSSGRPGAAELAHLIDLARSATEPAPGAVPGS
jgi:Ca-activated chloride channel homolog